MARLGTRFGIAVAAAALASVGLTVAEPTPAGTGSADRTVQATDARRADELLLRRRAVAGRAATIAPATADVAIAPAPAQFDGPPQPAGPLPATLRRFLDGERHPGGGVWAVIVGIDDYPGTRSDLRSAVADADDVDRALAAFGVPADRRVVLRDREASEHAIGVALDWLVANADADATAIFFYAGHGRRVTSARHSIVGSDGAAITDLALREGFRGLRAAQTWIGMAACYGGGFDELVTEGRLLTAAADANHLAYENPSYGRSYMVEFMVRRAMIEGAATTSVQASYDYAASALGREHPNRTLYAVDASRGPIDLRHGRDPASAPRPTAAPREVDSERPAPSDPPSASQVR